MVNRKNDFGYGDDVRQRNVIMIMSGIALLVIIVILCVLIWRLAHADQKDNTINTDIEAVQEEHSWHNESATEKESEPVLEKESEPVPEKESEPVPEKESEPVPEKESEPVPEKESEPVPEKESKPVKEVSDPNTVTTKDGRNITFTSCDDVVSPKIEVNLRLEPSTSQGNDTIHMLLKYGENVRRTGYDDASGWSRVEHDGKTLYVVTSYIYVVEETEE